MKSSHNQPGPVARWLIYAGMPLAVWGFTFILGATDRALERAVGNNLLPYCLVAIPAIIMLVAMLLYSRCPKGLVILLGVLGWVAYAVEMCWFFWFGPGALRM